MNFDIGAVFGQIVAAYTRLPLGQKIAIPFLFFVTMGLIVFVARWAGRPDYGLLFSDLQESDGAAIVERLKDQKIDYRLRNDGKVVEISPPDRVHELRLELASLGLPRGGSVGFELFSETALGRTGFVEKIMLVRALQGELERTIQSISAVKSVRVHITNPEKSVFVKRDTLPTASVMLQLKAGQRLTAVQIRGIANLVSHSVERLTLENVTIIDSDGNILSEQPSPDELGGADSTRLQQKATLESDYARRIETMLTEVLGPGRAIARVTAELDHNKYEKEEEAYDPGGQVVRSERSSVEASGLTAEGGVPGVISNLTNQPELLTPPDGSKNANKRSENVKNYEVSRAVSRTISAPGTIKKLSVAVLVDGQYENVANGQGTPEGTSAVARNYKPLTTEMLRKIENLAKQAVGFDSSRGDIISVENIRFIEPDGSMTEALAQAENQNFVFEMLQWGLPVFFGLLFFLIVLKPLVGFLIKPGEAEVDLSRLLPAGLEELEAELEAERSKVSARPVEETPHIDIEELEELMAENSRVVKENPQQAALLIRYWLNDGRV